MRPPLSDVVLFDSDSFSVECPSGHDLPLADDLAGKLADALRRQFPELAVGEPCREDWGTVIHVSEGAAYALSVHWAPLSKSDKYTWAVQFKEQRGCLLALFGGARPAHKRCGAIMDRVDSVLRGEPDTFRNVRWMTDREFESVY